MNKRSGFTLVEAMLVLIMMSLVMSAIYLMILYFRDVSGTEQARVRQTQESRYLLSTVSTELKNAGSVMTLVNTAGFLATPPYFNGLFPLNNTTFSDGVIVASGDPNAVSKLVSEADMSSATSLSLNNTFADPVWKKDDRGIMIGPDGYYVFSVASTPATGSTTLAIRPEAVYYSGLLNTTNYADAAPAAGAGNTLTYPVNSPVMRLGEFSIYLVQERTDAAKGRKVRELVRISDCFGKPAVLTDTSAGIVKGVIAENVWDMQLSYTTFPNFPNVSPTVNYFSSGGSSVLADLLDALRLKTLKEIAVSVVVLTDDFPGGGTISYPLPQLADRQAGTLPTGKFNYRTLSFLVQPRNFNIII